MSLKCHRHQNPYKSGEWLSNAFDFRNAIYFPFSTSPNCLVANSFVASLEVFSSQSSDFSIISGLNSAMRASEAAWGAPLLPVPPSLGSFSAPGMCACSPGQLLGREAPFLALSLREPSYSMSCVGRCQKHLSSVTTPHFPEARGLPSGRYIIQKLLQEEGQMSLPSLSGLHLRPQSN